MSDDKKGRPDHVHVAAVDEDHGLAIDHDGNVMPVMRVKEGTDLRTIDELAVPNGDGTHSVMTPEEFLGGCDGPRTRPATRAYRDGWDRIFGQKAIVGQA